MAAHGQGRKIHLRLFLEGIEVPVVGASVNASIGSGASANVQVVPTDRALELKPRTLVHLFYLDEGAGPARWTIPEDEWGEAKDRGQYRLMFCGEIVSVSMSKSPGSRSVTFQCLDTSSYWDTTFQYMMSVSSDKLAERPAAYLGASDNLFDDVVNNPSTVLAGMLTKTPLTPDLQNATGLLGGVIHTLEAVGGVPGIRAGANLYNTIAELRVKNTHQVGAVEDDVTAGELFKAKAFTQWLENSLGGMGDLVSFRDVVGLFNSHTYHNICPNPTPRYILGERVSGLSDEIVATSAVSDESAAREIAEHHGRIGGCNLDLAQRCVALARKIGADPYDLAAIIQKESEWNIASQNTKNWEDVTEPPPGTFATGLIQFTPANVYDLPLLAAKVSHFQKRNVVWRKKWEKGTIEGGHSADDLNIQLGKTQRARREVGTLILELTPEEHFELMYQYFTRGARPPAEGWSLRSLLMKVFYPAYVNEPGNTKFPDDVIAQQQGKRDSPPFTTPDEYTALVVPKLVRGRGSGLADIPTREASSFAEKRRAARLLTQIIRPDVWFVAPPRCNVIFPEQQLSVNYARGYMREVSRIQLRTNLEILGSEENALLASFNYSPRVEEFRKEFEAGGHLTKNFTMQHERFTGIVPRFERMGQVNFFANKTLTEARAAQGLSSDADALRKHVADFNFFRHRFSSRSMEVSCYFNPYLALGFPGVVIQRGFTPPGDMTVQQVFSKIKESVTGFELEGGITYLPTAMLGLVSSLSHSISQSGGTSSVSFTQARSHRTADGSDDEFLNLFIGARERALAGVTMITHFDHVTSNITDSPEAAKFLYGRSVSASMSVELPSLEDLQGDAEIRLLDTVGINGGTITSVTVGGVGPYIESWGAGAVPAGVPEEHPADHGAVFFSDIIIEERVTFSREDKEAFATTKIQTPVEMALFPPWFSDVYYNDKIGKKVYEPLFGTGSVVDDQVFQLSEADRLGSLRSNHVYVDVDVTVPSTDGTAAAEKSEAVKIKVEQSVSIAQAVDALATVYGHLKSSQGDHLDLTKFIQNYTFRPVARMDEVLGRHVEFDKDGALTKGEEGFHSRAVAELTGLKGLINDPNKRMPKVSMGTPIQLNPDMDPRQARRAKVLAYRRELLGRGGDLGRGLEG